MPPRSGVHMATDHVPGRLLDLRSVEVLDRHPFVTDEMVRRGSWVCAACGERRSIEGSWELVVRNRQGMSLERPVVVCDHCHRELVVEPS